METAALETGVGIGYLEVSIKEVGCFDTNLVDVQGVQKTPSIFDIHYIHNFLGYRSM